MRFELTEVQHDLAFIFFTLQECLQFIQCIETVPFFPLTIQSPTL